MGRNKKEYAAIKIVTTRKAHACECCDDPIPKGTKALVDHGFNYDEGYFRYYFHLTDFSCYGTFMEVCGIHPESEDGKMILEAAKAAKPSVAAHR